jgi:hypothetical protein
LAYSFENVAINNRARGLEDLESGGLAGFIDDHANGDTSVRSNIGPGTSSVGIDADGVNKLRSNNSRGDMEWLSGSSTTIANCT